MLVHVGRRPLLLVIAADITVVSPGPWQMQRLLLFSQSRRWGRVLGPALNALSKISISLVSTLLLFGNAAFFRWWGVGVFSILEIFRVRVLS